MGDTGKAVVLLAARGYQHSSKHTADLRACYALAASPLLKSKWQRLEGEGLHDCLSSHAWLGGASHGEVWGLALVKRGVKLSDELAIKSGEFKLLSTHTARESEDLCSIVVVETARVVPFRHDLHVVSETYDAGARQYNCFFVANGTGRDHVMRQRFQLEKGMPPTKADNVFEAWGVTMTWDLHVLALHRPVVALVVHGLWNEVLLPAHIRCRVSLLPDWPPKQSRKRKAAEEDVPERCASSAVASKACGKSTWLSRCHVNCADLLAFVEAVDDSVGNFDTSANELHQRLQASADLIRKMTPFYVATAVEANEKQSLFAECAAAASIVDDMASSLDTCARFIRTSDGKYVHKSADLLSAVLAADMLRTDKQGHT
eukprot:6472209-Amphidinium_carterae.1